MLFPALDQKTRSAIDQFLDLIARNFPLEKRFRRNLPGDVAELSRLFTSDRKIRDTGYLGRPAMLSAYLYHYLPWNVYKLCKLFGGIASESGGRFPELDEDDAVTDLGSGPLTLPIALWISFPALRNCKLEFRCVDRTGLILDAGRKLFDALIMESAGLRLWRVKTIRGPLDAPLYGKRSSLIAAANVFNESAGVEKAAVLIDARIKENGHVLVVEPGTPPSGRFISALRTALGKHGISIKAPCTHCGSCPMPSGANKKWCHFPTDTSDAPERLKALSNAAGIPKERAVVSFLFAQKTPAPATSTIEANTNKIRIISDAFPLPGREEGFFGRYGCYEQGLALVRGSKEKTAPLLPGALINQSPADGKDTKSGAAIFTISSPPLSSV
ncbi:MAG: small ribosomal subunit Rsm22 family protein [Treponema sp.]|jgi:ribosomal protein RSM22 (predicted rRNA methylase)|nr:small ribosomal subunit Rsm22 family protein [Treponema sp.]